MAVIEVPISRATPQRQIRQYARVRYRGVRHWLWGGVAVVLVAATSCTSDADGGPEPRTGPVLAEGEWSGGTWSLRSVETEREPLCLTLDPLSDPGCTEVPRTADVKLLLEGGSPREDENPYRYLVAAVPPAVADVQARTEGAARQGLPLLELPGTALRAAVFVADYETYAATRIEFIGGNGEPVAVLP